MTYKLQRFTDLMRSIFELDKSDLDFGIYRIMNIRKAEIEKFLTEGLPHKVQDTLAPFASDNGTIRQCMAEIEKKCTDVGMDVASSRMADEYAELKRKLNEGTDLSALETDVYSALYSFFNRYYDEGDFISKRRYKEGVYAIPYEGEEVKLYWANQDQYYIKTTENFKDYTFVNGDLTVHFRLVDATTEQNNNKESDDKKRVFMLYEESDERPELKTFETNGNELIIRFVYGVPSDQKKKQDAYTQENYKKITDFILQRGGVWGALLGSISADPKQPKKVIQKHLEAYVAKNSFDYFIHKDLCGFLTRELDFYIKSEIIHLDDLDTSDEKPVSAYLAKVKAVKRVGKIIIDFLAQIEDFQKKLWLKKKFVVETNWCITLDRIDERFYPEILANKAQVREWVEMYAIDEIAGDLATVGYSDPPTLEFVKQNQNLIVDMKHFSVDFKDRLIASIDDLDENTGGLLVWSENYQAERLITSSVDKRVSCLYLDPPYNTNEATFLYKNNYKHSTWAAMITDRISHGFNCLEDNGVMLITIDDAELYHLKEEIDAIIGPSHYIGTIVIQSNPRGRGINSFYATCHEYCLCYAKNPELTMICDQPLTEEQENEYKHEDSDSSFRLLPFRRSGGWSVPTDRPNSEFPLYFDEKGVLFAVGGERTSDSTNLYTTNCIITNTINGYTEMTESAFTQSYPKAFRVMPIDTNGIRRVWRWSDRYKILDAGKNGDFVLKRDAHSPIVQLKDRIKNGRKPKTVWVDSKYDSSSHGTNLLKNIFAQRYMFGFPKSLYSTQDSLFTTVGENDKAIILDLFGGSSTTGHAVVNLNRDDGGNRKYILVEMGEYFNTVTKPRMQKIIYSSDWKDGKPVSRATGISHIMKYIKLESYEDALSNIELSEEQHNLTTLLGEEYMIHYMLDIEAEGSLLKLDRFKQPFAYKMKINENNETKEKAVDLVETFNYLLGLTVVRQSAVARFDAETDAQAEYEGAVKLVATPEGPYTFKQVEGTLPDGSRALVIWRTVTDDLIASNAALDAYFLKNRINPQDREFNVIYVNGDSNLENLRNEDETWKVRMTEIAFKERMFEEA